ncbi:Nucleoside 2-deoxyribosyltransferase like [Glycomyces sambucus]|uniref:Nucleoside 2-deoxyribosyltransferase like n=1 Tax=Glycomyces sambucus TaxID=380244 RepID=A0A1G9CVU3_9ACTN|nr:nucleoside 2-deoxyribosyltransferase domain-containing protein [Glycomyces sambucus]SDK55575.1 Nucleoside 2-deoxyribosyltransferase like [Glycomyces sambucus]
MASEVVVVHANETPPPWWDAAVFLAGPLPRSADVPSWNPEAVAHLRERWTRGGRLVVFTPELRAGVLADYTGQIEWEHRGLHDADVVLFWVPRDLESMPAFTTNIEFGTWYDSGKVVFGAPAAAPKNEYLLHLAASRGVPVAAHLGDAADAALAMIGDGSRREGGERSVPLLVWRTESFQTWYRAQRAAGNVLEGARLEWTFRVGEHREAVMYWAAHVQVRVAAEDRVKANEVVISRPDTAQVLLYRPGPSLDETTVVLVREFRSPASTPDGFVHELPGGSSREQPDPAVQALEEVHEETGLKLGADRLRPIGTRQVAATMSAHRAHVFAAEVTEDELAWLREQRRVAHGENDGERTWVEVATYGELRGRGLTDWATLGMIAQALGQSQTAGSVPL